MASIGDLFMQLLADGSKLTPSVQKEAAKAGDAGAKTLGQRLSSGLKTNGLKVFGTVAAAAFGLAAKGALQLEDAAARVRAETGATADEAKAAAKAINAAAGSEQASLEAVTETAIRVRRDLGATGEEADALTERFTRFARVTRQDAAGAVADFDDILDAWGLTAKDAAGIQDKLLVSGQKYGGTITANQKALAALAPSLKAMNVGLDDGIGLIGLFNASGLDAEGQVRALNAAVKSLKPGQSIRDLIAEIAAIEDPTVRAQRAIEVFGAKGGVELANALRPGMTGLDDFKVSTAEATGATDKAADALDSTWGGRFRKLMSEAGAAVRGLGADFGVALSALGTLGSVGTALGLDRLIAKAFGSIPGSAIVKGAVKGAAVFVGTTFSGAVFVAEKLAGAAGAAFDAIPGSAVVKAAAARAGALMGTTAGKAFGVPFAIAAVAGLFLLLVDEFNKQQDNEKAMGDAIGASIADLIVNGTLDQLQTARGALQKGIGDLLVTNAASPLVGIMKAQLDQVDAELNRRALQGVRDGEHAAYGAGQAIASAAASGLSSGGPGPSSFAAAAKTLARELPLRLLEAGAATREAAARLPSAIAAGIRERRDQAKAAFDDLVELLKHPMSRAKELGRLIGFATSKALVKGLRSKDPEIKASAQAAQQIWLAELAQLASEGVTPGKKAMAKLERDLKSKNPAVRAAAVAAKKAIDEGLVTQVGKSPGDVVGDQVIADLKDKDTAIGKVGYTQGQIYARNLLAGVKGTGFVPPKGSTGTGVPRRGSPNPSYDVGSWSVPTTGPATVHKAEIIVPRTSADAIRSGDAVLTTGGLEPAGASITVEIANIDASGHSDPRVAGHTAAQEIIDVVTTELRNQRLRYVGGTRR